MERQSDADKGNEATSNTTVTFGNLPVAPELHGAAVSTSDLEDGPARRIAAPSYFGPTTLKSTELAPGSLKETPEASLSVPKPCVRASRSSKRELRENPYRSSLVDMDDDELYGLLGTASNKDVPSKTQGWSGLANVPVLPHFYPLDKSSVFVPHISAHVIANRIQNVLRDRSISATYQPNQAKAECVSADVEFQIRLYKGRGDFDHGIIVEVKRLNGFSNRYQRDVFAILDAAEGKVISNDPEFIPVDVAVADASVDVAEEFTPTSLSVLAEILRSKGDDTTISDIDFVLSSLATVTNPNRMGQAASEICKELTNSKDYGILRDLVFSNMSSTSQDFPLIAQRVTNKALETLANMAITQQGTTQLFEVIIEARSDAINILISYIQDAAIEARMANNSCVIIKHLCDDAVTLSKVDKEFRHSLVPALVIANSYGKDFHNELKVHSQQCLCLFNV